MSQKSEKVGVVTSNKMQKSIVVAVEWQVRHGLYGKTERGTSTFMVPDEKNEARAGDIVAMCGTRARQPELSGYHGAPVSEGVGGPRGRSPPDLVWERSHDSNALDPARRR